MKIRKYTLLLSVFWPSFAFSQDVSLTVINQDKAPLESVHAIVNKRVVSVSDVSGIIRLKGFNKSDTIRLSHLLYEDLSLQLPAKDSVVCMTPRLYSLETVSIDSGNQWPLLKQKLRPGLKVGRSVKQIPFSSENHFRKDTSIISLESRGSVVFISPSKRPRVSLDGIRDPTGQSVLSSNGLKEWKKYLSNALGTKLGNCLYYSGALCKKKRPNGWLTDYLGVTEGCDVFRFYQIPQSLKGEAKIRGLAYIDCTSGILVRIEAILSPIDIRVSNPYCLDVSFEYFPSTNTILPKHYSCDSYQLNHQGFLSTEINNTTIVEW